MTSSQPVKRKQNRNNNQEDNAKSGHMKQTMEICKTAAGKLPPKPTQSVSSVFFWPHTLFAKIQQSVWANKQFMKVVSADANVLKLKQATLFKRVSNKIDRIHCKLITKRARTL